MTSLALGLGPTNAEAVVVHYGRGLLLAARLHNWRVRITGRLTSSLGKCGHARRTVLIARWLVEAARVDAEVDAELVDTVRHEVAHAVVGPGHGHKRTWKEAARQLGAKPAGSCRTTSVSRAVAKTRPPAKWLAVCTACRRGYARRRLTARERAGFHWCRCQAGVGPDPYILPGGVVESVRSYRSRSPRVLLHWIENPARRG